MEKDYSLLRPFDLDAAKRGEAICTHSGNHLDFVAADENNGSHCVRIGDRNSRSGRLSIWGHQRLRMAPLCWVEGKPVYKGDVLYQPGDRRTFKITGYEEKSGGLGKPCLNYGTTREYVEKFTWAPPKVKREGWVNIYGAGGNARAAGEVHPDKATADRAASRERVACVPVEWEEPSAP